MAKSKTPSFITEVKLKVSSQQERELLARFQAGRQLYNNCLNDAIKRMELLKNSDAYKQAKKMPKGQQKNEAFKELRKQYRYSEYDLHSYAAIVAKKSKWIAQKVDSNTQQKLATRAFEESEKVLFGIASSVRYKVLTRFRSMEGKSNGTGIRWKDNQLVWGKLQINAILPEDDLVLWHGLNSPI
ncbi:MAG TPA: transposase, partial [Leptolyngbyaceae cyanobacterium]